jgi:hypothetical protein
MAFDDREEHPSSNDSPRETKPPEPTESPVSASGDSESRPWRQFLRNVLDDCGFQESLDDDAAEAASRGGDQASSERRWYGGRGSGPSSMPSSRIAPP